MSNHHRTSTAWWERPELLIQRRIMEARYGKIVHLPHEGLYTVMVEQLSSGQHRATFNRSHGARSHRWTVYIKTGLGADLAPAVAKACVVKLASDLPDVPGVYDAKRNGGEWAVTKRASKRKVKAVSL